MARARNIKPGFFHNEQLAECSFAARLTFIGLWTEADREGRLEDRPRRLKMTLFPADDVDMDELLSELEAQSLIQRYRVEDKALICLPKFTKHQSPHHNEAGSQLAGPEQAEEKSAGDHGPKDLPPRTKALRPESLNLIPEPPSLNEEPPFLNPDVQPTSPSGTSACASDDAPGTNGRAHRFDDFWAIYPRRRDKKKAREVWIRKRLDERADIIMDDVRHRARHDGQWKEGYIPLPTTYLRGERWEDEYTQPARDSGSSSGVEQWREQKRRELENGQQ